MVVQIDWNQLKQNMYSKEISFERFCFHYASILFKGYGQMTYPYNAAGSEFYLELTKPLEYEGRLYKKGDLIGWQAKFWLNHNDMDNSSLASDHRNELKRGFIKTLERVPNLALWIICTPGQFKEDAYSTLKHELKLAKPDVNIVHWHKPVFELSIVGSDRSKFHGLWAYYFGKKTISKELLDNLTQTTIESLNRKFDVDLHTTTSFESQLLSIIDGDIAFATLSEKIVVLKERLEHYESRWYGDDGTRCGSDFSKLGVEFESAFIDYENCVLNLARQIVLVGDNDDVDEMYKTGMLCLVSGRKAFDVFASKLQGVIRRLSADLKQWVGYWGEDILEIKNLIFGTQDHREDSIEYVLKLRSARYFPVFAQAGYGKTHFACSLASKLLDKNHPVILVTGGRFRNCERPQEVLLNVLGMEGGSMSFEDLIEALDLLASNYSRERLPIIIDGLNESFPNERVWADELPLMLKCIEKTDHLILVTTCREKTEYIQKIFGRHTYDKVENASLLSGIEYRNLLETIHKYFKKYDIIEESIADKTVFSNPLFLKIFCETHSHRSGIVINEHTLVESMKLYSDSLVANLSIKDGAVDRIVQYNICKGLRQLGRILWQRNTRNVDYFEDFYPIFKEHSENLLDEGLCFQVEQLSPQGGEVQFTYDLLAGYHIAQYLMSETKNAKDLSQLLNSDTTYKRLFGSQNELHALAEDIIRTLIVIVRERENQSLFELVKGDTAFAKILEGLEIMRANESEQIAIRLRLSSPINAEVKKAVARIAAEKILNNNSVSGISLLIPAFTQFTREEFDLYFHERFLGYGLLKSSFACVKKNLKDGVSVTDAILSAVLLSGCFDLKSRNEILCVMIEYARKNFQNLTALFSECIKFDDPYIREAVYIIIHGSVVGLGNTDDVLSAVQIITSDMINHPTSNAVLLDYAESLFDYAKIVHKIDVNYDALRSAKESAWHTTEFNEIWKSVIIDYDFENYHIVPYSDIAYESHSKYSVEELTNMLLSMMKHNGYNDEVYASLSMSHNESARYNQSVVRSIPYKHLRDAHLELVGWLLLNGQISSEYKQTLRTTEIDVDPSFPSLCQMRQLITNSLLPRAVEEKMQWLIEDPLKSMRKYLNKKAINDDAELVLLYGRVLQKSEEKEAQFYWRSSARFVNREVPKETLRINAIGHSHLLASEIGWRNMEFTEDDYNDLSSCLIPLHHYEFSGWTENRSKNRSFYFIADKIRQDCGLEFNVKDMTYYQCGKPATEHFQDDSSEFLYIKRELIEEIKGRYNLDFVIDCYAEKINTGNDDVGLGYGAIKQYRETI